MSRRPREHHVANLNGRVVGQSLAPGHRRPPIRSAAAGARELAARQVGKQLPKADVEEKNGLFGKDCGLKASKFKGGWTFGFYVSLRGGNG